jgi:HEAT repeat protein
VRSLFNLGQGKRGGGWRCLAGAAFTGLGLCGCSGFWDEVTSRDFEVHALFVKPNPLVVLKESNDGDARAKALRALREPQQYGGTKEEQEAVVRILTTAAVTERQPLCRLAAIQSLGNFKDPRATQALKDAFYQAGSFPPDIATRIQCQALASLGETGDPGAIDLLVRAVKQPPAEGAEQDKQQTLDVRIAAARALGKFNQPQGTEALVLVLRTEKDVALRDRAHESLQASTGKDLPPDPKAWEDLLHQANAGNSQVATDESRKHKVLGLF